VEVLEMQNVQTNYITKEEGRVIEIENNLGLTGMKERDRRRCHLKTLTSSIAKGSRRG
jgi:hypothetical protein